MMRTLIFLSCTTFFGLSFNDVVSQNLKIRINEAKQATVDEVFDLIMAQTDYTFIYQVDMFKDAPKVQLYKGVVRVNNLLAQSLTLGDYNFDVTNTNTIVIRKNTSSINTQQFSVSGTIVDRYGIPLPGLSVYITDDLTTENVNIIRGTTTDFDGKYTLTVNPGQFIVVSGIGYETTQTLVLENKTSYDFILKESINELDEVVVSTGYQKIPKERATGLFNTIPTRELNNTVTQTMGSILQGIAPGIQVVEDADGNIDISDVVIRGVGTISSDSAPLVVVDGFPIDGGFDTINPNDIASITILKDAASASIWGARAGNGVIVIVTKKGQRKGLNVEVSSFIKMRSKINLDRNVTRANSATTLALESTIWGDPDGQGANNFFIANYPAPSTLFDRANVNRSGNTSYSLGARAYFDAHFGNITQAELARRIDYLSGINSFDDAERYLLTNPINKQYNIALSSKGENSHTRLSAVYNDNTNAFIGDENNQLLINLNADYEFNNWLSGTVVGMVDNSFAQNRGLSLGDIQNMSPYENLINADGSYSSMRHGTYDAKYMEFFANTITNLPYDNLNYNLLRDARNNNFRSKENNYRITGSLNIKLLDGLELIPSVTYQQFQTNTNSYWGTESSFVKYLVMNSTGQPNYDPTNAMVGEPEIPVGDIFRGGQSESSALTYRTTLNYNKVFGLHAVTAFAGYEREKRTIEASAEPYTYGFDPETYSYTVPLNRQGSTPLWPGFGDTGIITDGRFFNISQRRFVSYFGNLAYTFDRRYTLSGSARSDGANYIVEDKTQRYNPMWSVGFSWNAKNESFLRDVDAIRSLKFRVTNGENGNIVNSASTTATIGLSATPNPFTNVFTASLNSLGNPDLRWERVHTFNVGADFNLFDSALYGSIDYYNKESKDLIATIDLPATLGVSSGTFNVGEMINKGIELNLSSNIKIAKDLNLITNVVYSHNDSEVTSLKDLLIFPRSITDFNYIEGNPYQPIYAFEYGGLQTIDSQPEPYPTIIGQNGKIYGMDENIGVNGEDGREVLKYMGTRVAPTVLGWNNTITFKNFTLNTRIVGKFGHKFRRPTYDYSGFLQDGNHHEDLELILAGRHDELGLPPYVQKFEQWQYRWGWYVPYLDSLVEDAGHIRLRQIFLGYDLPSQVVEKLGITNFRLFASAENLGNIWTANDFNIDPEYINGLVRSPEKTFSFGLNVQF
ncbi:SusC/RagA family TonB-linked outer membrane protein [Tamlana fucoidanivorans]|nr:SusC/RagA family TonB-linked outer membrane protein [Tamlana fucoidanivorans]